MSEIYEYALSFYGLPYIWGGEFLPPASGGDCSGLCQRILTFGGCQPPGDRSADALYRHFLWRGEKDVRATGSLAFFGTKERIIHVGFMIDSYCILNASGGGSHVRTLNAAKELNAHVKIEPLTLRKNLVATIMPPWDLVIS